MESEPDYEVMLWPQRVMTGMVFGVTYVLIEPHVSQIVVAVFGAAAAALITWWSISYIVSTNVSRITRESVAFTLFALGQHELDKYSTQ